MLSGLESAACLRVVIRNGPGPAIHNASKASNRVAIGKARDIPCNVNSSYAGHATKLTHLYVASPHDG